MKYRCSVILLTALNVLYWVLMATFVLTHQQHNDFMSLYYAAKAQIPYQEFHPIWCEQASSLPYNLNPPIVFLMFTPFAMLPYFVSAILWLCSLMVMGLVSCYLSLSILFSDMLWKKHWPLLALLYCMFGGCLANESFLQLGTLIALLIIGGYYLLLRQREREAGVIWGVAAGIKLFPVLLFFYLLSQKKWKGACAFVFTMLILFLLPLHRYPASIYVDYTAILQSVSWYGDSWNASLYGYLHRVFSGNNVSNGMFLIASGLGFFWYLKQLLKAGYEHQNFSLTLLMMLFLSPFGWYYYCPLLIFPLLMLSRMYVNQLWFLLGFFFLNLPIEYISERRMGHMFDKTILYSVYFYAVLLFICLVSRNKKPDILSSQSFSSWKMPIISILFTCFIMRLICACLII